MFVKHVKYMYVNKIRNTDSSLIINDSVINCEYKFYYIFIISSFFYSIMRLYKLLFIIKYYYIDKI